LDETKFLGSYADLDSDSEQEKGKHIIDVEPIVTIASTKVQLEQPDDREEGECLFHSKMQVKGTLIHFIVGSNIQKNQISAWVFKILNLTMMSHP
jgi:hypothetical protein